MKQTLEELKKKLSIDQYGLETECTGQPELYETAGELMVNAKSAARTSKDYLDFVKADLSFKIRSNPENGVDSTVVVQHEYRKAQAEYIEAQELADSFSVLLTAVEQRKSMLKDLVTLFVYNYYSDTHEMSSERQAMNPVTKEQIINKRREAARDRQSNKDEVPEEEE
jgi:hypothetical protein